MRHAAATVLADWKAGRLAAGAAERVAHHVEGCARCAERAVRLARASAAMAAIADEPAPELGWDHIAARVHWHTASARRQSSRRARRWLAPALVGAGAALGATVVVLGLGGAGETALVARAPDPTLVATPTPGPAAALVGVVTFAQGEVRLDGRGLEFDRPLGPGDVLATGAGRVAVQFGAGSGFALGPHSRITLVGFDEAGVELELDGAVEVEVSHRAAGQRFAVVAGARRVEVRGTHFTVEQAAARLAVACSRGEVVVRDASGLVAVPAGLGLALEPGALVASARPRPIDPVRLAALDRALAVPLLPAWTEGRALFQTSTALDIAAAPGLPVVVDGVAVGEGGFRLRVMSGRHQVQAGSGDGQWVEGGPGAVAAVAVARPSAAAGGSADARRTRLAELAAGLDGSRAARACLRSLEKQGLVEGSFATFDVGIDERGAKRHVNVVASNLPPALERCLRDVVDQAELPPGPAATVRYKLAF